MRAISVKGVTGIKGSIEIQGSKNTVLPIIAASILTTGVTRIHNCPEIEDVSVMCELLHCLGVKTRMEEHVLEIDTEHIEYNILPGELTGRLRSSVLLLGPMISRFHKVQIGMPGGCAIGSRPIDIHLDGLMGMNVEITKEKDYLQCKCFHLQGCEYHLRFPSVGATENLLMAAAGAVGRTILRGAAREPEVIELCRYLVSVGVVIEGIGTDVLVIKGTGTFYPADYVNPYDRIVAGTYILMSAALPSEVRLYGIHNTVYIANIIELVKNMGVAIVEFPDHISIHSSGTVKGGNFITGIYPDFPTELQPLLITILMRCREESTVTETIFENRLGVVDALKRLGGNVSKQENIVYINYSDCLCGHTVRATDLRQGAALVVAGLLCEGYTTITDVEYILRGYEDIVRDLKCLGVDIAYV